LQNILFVIQIQHCHQIIAKEHHLMLFSDLREIGTNIRRNK